ncbi:MAG TPA: spermidine/putrescine ABC transporter substrate-binding protein [Egicoccus sp.]|nr:spermidine/putrescine ABC transporter substrate-binding protein [Egicoccus sp.]HSK21560.1 spermidine/putrescine ABC transporter substrate-binding protein [Egicoccus sp.]
MRVRTLVAVPTVLALALLGCGREVGGDPEAAGEDGAAAESAGADCEVGETDGDLLFYNWSDYIDPELVTAFEEEFDVSVTQDFYPSNEELLAKIQSGGADYDVIVPSDYMVNIMIEEGLLAPMDRDLVPNADNIADEFADPPYDAGNEFSIPYQWGTTGLGVNLDEVGEDVDASWALVFDPEVASQYAGRIALLDDPRETMGAALYYLGYSANTTSEEELQEAADLISEASENFAAFDSNLYTDLLLSGEVVISHGFSGNYFAAFAEAEGNFTYLIPEEGATKWVDTMAVLEAAPHPCTAYTFINFLLDAENGAQLTNWNYYASPNAAAEEFILPEVLEDPAIYPPEDTNLTFLEDTGDAEILFNDYFTRAKS